MNKYEKIYVNKFHFHLMVNNVSKHRGANNLGNQLSRVHKIIKRLGWGYLNIKGEDESQHLTAWDLQ